jgi:hypothetical protein
MKIHWIQCRDLEQSDHSALVRSDLIEVVRIERAAGGAGDEWQVYVDAAGGRTFRFGAPQPDRASAVDMAKGLLMLFEQAER